MKNQGLILALGVGALILLSAKSKAKKPAYTITVPPPEIITQQQYQAATSKRGLVQKVVPKILQIFKKKPTLTAQQKAAATALSKGFSLRGVGQFPDMC
jgi:hypothetical protein